MRLGGRESVPNSQLVHLHGPDWISRQREAGKCHAQIMTLLRSLLRERTILSLLELDRIAEDEMLKGGCTPTFKGYRGFPSACCISVNQVVVHGIPSSYQLHEGDVVSFDFGTTFEGAIADAADTMIFGKATEHSDMERMIGVTQECLHNAIRAIRPGVRLGVTGNSIYKTAQRSGYNVVNSLGGHSLTWNTPHAFLFLPNKATPEDGIVIQPGLTLAVEPIVGKGDNNIRLMEDGWGVVTPSVFAHVEHTLFVHEDCVEVMTRREDETLPHKLYF